MDTAPFVYTLFFFLVMMILYTFFYRGFSWIWLVVCQFILFDIGSLIESLLTRKRGRSGLRLSVNALCYSSFEHLRVIIFDVSMTSQLVMASQLKKASSNIDDDSTTT